MKERGEVSKYTFGDIYLVRFHPSFGQELKRYRPVIILSSVVNNLDSRFTLVGAISTKINSKNKYEVVIANQCLEQKSAILLWYVRTVDIERVERKIGQLSEKDCAKCKQVLQKVFE